jgi:peptidoglycan/LPS O-acetylase OafA/YrhL
LGSGETFGARYSPVSAAMLPFSLGALTYFGARGRVIALPLLPVLLGWIGVIIVATRVPTEGVVWDIVFYANIATIFATVVSLSQREFGPLDKALGELSYPVFLMHWLVGFALSDLFGHRSIMLALATLPVAICASVALIWASNLAIEPIRNSIRNRAARNDGAQPAKEPQPQYGTFGAT